MTLPDRAELGPQTVELRFEPAGLEARDLAPLRLAGAWTVASDDPRVGGISALAVDGGELIALTDSGVVIRFAKPSGGAVGAEVRELPAGPGDPGFKTSRDSEGLTRDPAGRGWWVAFEVHNQLWLFDRDFTKSLQRRAVPPRQFGDNKGIEGLTSAGGRLMLFPEAGGFAIQTGVSGWSEIRFDFQARRVSDAATLPDQSLAIVERRLTVSGFANVLVRLKRCGARYCASWRLPLAVGRLDNIEAIAVEPLETGAIRLWLMTDDNSHRPLRTLLIAADLPPPPT